MHLVASLIIASCNDLIYKYKDSRDFGEKTPQMLYLFLTNVNHSLVNSSLTTIPFSNNLLANARPYQPHRGC
jgi:hypothetical protein